MRVHHLNCVSARAFGRRRRRRASHCLLVESSEGLVLVDTGYGLRDVHEPMRRLGRFFLFMRSPDLRESMTAARQVETLGFSRDDVRHIVLTHLHADHAGGLDDFPNAVVHVLEREREAAVAQKTMLDRMRYRPAQWSTMERWRTYPSDEGDDWFGFQAVRGLVGLPPEIAIVPLFGHTLGHAGVAVRLETRWLLHAGDASLNDRRLRELQRSHRDDVTIISSHDSAQFERLAGRPLDVPLGISREGDEMHAWREIEAQSF